VPTPDGINGVVDNNNGFALNYNTDTSQETCVYATLGGPASVWASIAIAFEAP